LPTHTSTAVAMVDTSVNIVTAEELEQLLLSDDRLALRLADAGEREFDDLRAKSLNPSLLPALQRLAHYLLAIASINGAEGRDGMLIADDVSSGYVARQLHMTIDTLAMALLSLRRGGIVEVSCQGLRIVDLVGLEALAATA
jgi:CRP-like cAMP-binding protein